jgi:lysophospholipase L1-like esterase
VSSESRGFIASGGGRGSLSTTITMDAVAVDPVPTIDHQTIRVMLRTTAAGSQVMVKLTNRYSAEPLGIGAAHVGIGGPGGVVAAGSDRTLLFGGLPAVSIGAGAEAWSDPVDLSVARGDTIAISLYVDARVTPTTQSGRCNLSWMTHYLSRPGDFTSYTEMPAATSGPAMTHTILFVAEVRVRPAGSAATLVTLGDSTTEGACSTIENGDWPDLLSDRLPALPDGTVVSVFNAGIGSGRFMSSDGAGLRGILRLEELLKLPNTRWVTVLMGVNDISYEHVEVAAFIAAYKGAISLAHAAGVKLIGIPILPFKGSYKDVGTNWATAQAVNAWIRSPKSGLDAVIDFEPVVGDPAHPGCLKPDWTVEGVHPNQEGQIAMANAVDLSIFR